MHTLLRGGLLLLALAALIYAFPRVAPAANAPSSASSNLSQSLGAGAGVVESSGEPVSALFGFPVGALAWLLVGVGGFLVGAIVVFIGGSYRRKVVGASASGRMAAP